MTRLSTLLFVIGLGRVKSFFGFITFGTTVWRTSTLSPCPQCQLQQRNKQQWAPSILSKHAAWRVEGCGNALRMKELPDEPAELERLEREYYENIRLQNVKRALDEFPRHRQCHRYRWHQKEEVFDVEIPMLNPCTEESLYLAILPDQLQIAVRNDDTFGAITGHFTGSVDPSESSFRIFSRDREYFLQLVIKKVAPEGTFEFWRSLLQFEEESPTIRFQGKTNKYSWKQNAGSIEVNFPVPDEVTKKGTHLELDPSGSDMKLSFDEEQYPSFGKLEGRFKGTVCPLDCVWMLDEFNGSKFLALTLMKRRDEKDRTSWWSGVLEGDDKW
ncbi:unnamed protein product [Discosporangium mesarthrocarpum]